MQTVRGIFCILPSEKVVRKTAQNHLFIDLMKTLSLTHCLAQSLNYRSLQHPGRYTILVCCCTVLVLSVAVQPVCKADLAETGGQQRQQSTKKQEKSKRSGKKQSSAKSTKTSVEAEQRKLERLQKQIEADREKLQSVKEKESSVAQKLNKQRKKKQQVETSLVILTRQMRRTQDSILKTAASIGTLEQRLVVMQREYRKFARRVVRQPAMIDNELLLLGTTRTQELVLHYQVAQVTMLARQRAQEIARLTDSLSGRKNTFAALLDRHEGLKSSEEHRQKRISQTIELSAKALDSIRADKKLLQQKLEEKNASARKMQSLITDLIAQENRRYAVSGSTKGSSGKNNRASKSRSNSRDDDEAHAAKQNADANRIIAGKFKAHSLPWPVLSRKILHGFGQYTNPATNTVMTNLGISIATPHSTPVHSVAKGTVSLVHWLPGYGSLVIVDHGNDFRTVYASLVSVSVSEGEEVSPETVVGKSGRSVDGEYVHFEVWHGRDKLNPSVWLKQ